MIPVKWLATIAKKRATLQINVLTFQKTSVGLGNLCAGDWICSKEVVRVSCIYYLVWFQEDQEQESQKQVKALLNNGSKINAMNPTFIRKLGFHIRMTNVGAQKINGSTLKTFRIVIADFQVEDKGGRPRFFQETFLVADTKFEVILGMLFLKISNKDITFGKRTLTRSHTPPTKPY